MKGQVAASIRTIETPEDFDETRLEAVGFVFHGVLPSPEAKRAARSGMNMLHFARCAKLDKAGDHEVKIWFRTLGTARDHLDTTVGRNHWKWCKVCEREVTQKIINEQ